MHNKFPINELPIRVRTRIYEFSDVDTILKDPILKDRYKVKPWARTVLLSGTLNDVEALSHTSRQGDEERNIICPLIALTGNLRLMKWARMDNDEEEKPEKRIKLTHGGPETANRAQSLVVKYKISSPLPWDAQSCTMASRGGHFELLKWMHEKGCPWDAETCARAAERADMDMLTWLRKLKCPWDQFSCAMAAQNGHLETLKWLRMKKCRWDMWTLAFSSQNGHEEVMEWALSNGCPLGGLFTAQSYRSQCVTAKLYKAMGWNRYG